MVLSSLMATTASAQAIQTNQGALATPAYRAEASMQDDILRQETVTTRVHPETDAQGINAGSWVILPSVGVDEQFNDNIYATNQANGGRVSDFITDVSPDVFIRSNWNNSVVTFDANSQNGFYGSHSKENFDDYSFAANGRFDITRQQYIAVRASYSFLHEPRTSPNNNFGIDPTTYGLTNGGFEYYNKFNRVSVTVDGSVNRFIYTNVPADTVAGFINETDRSRSEYSGSGRIGYEIQPLLEAFIRGEGSDRSYDHKVGSDGFQRSSTGYTVTTGVAIDLGGKTFGEVGVGYMARNYADSRFGTVGGVTANAAVTWNATTLDTVKLSVLRSIEETITFGSSGFVGTNGTVSIDHELLRNLLLNASVGVSYNDYQDSARRDTIVTAGVGATYLLNRNANIAFKYTYRDQGSTDSTLPYTQNLALVRLTLQM